MERDAAISIGLSQVERQVSVEDLQILEFAKRILHYGLYGEPGQTITAV
jgi:hypothetical protein